MYLPSITSGTLPIAQKVESDDPQQAPFTYMTELLENLSHQSDSPTVLEHYYIVFS